MPGARFVVLGLLTAASAPVFAAAPAMAAQSLSLLMVDWNPDVQKLFKSDLIPEFERENPGYTVSVDWAGWDTLPAKLTSGFASGTGPDVFQADPVEFDPAYYLKGQILDLDPYLKSWPDLKDFYQKPLDLEIYFKGHAIALPYLFDNRALFYRKDMFAESGLDPEADPQTWEELKGDARKLTQTDPAGKMVRAGFNACCGGYQGFVNFLWQNGGSLLNGEGRPAFQEQAGVEALEFWRSLIAGGVAPPPGVDVKETAMQIEGYWAIGDIAQQVGAAHVDERLGMSVLAHKRQAGLFYSNTYSISRQTSDPNGAWRLLAFLLRADNLGKYSTANHSLPTRKSLVETLPWLLPLHKRLIAEVFEAPASNTSPATPTTAKWAYGPLQDQIEKALAGTIAPQAALDIAAQQTAAIMDEYGPW